jgi:type I restriction enzyme, R subunit
MPFNEDSRVKIPALVHLTRLGYGFLLKSEMVNYHGDTNIFLDIFRDAISRINHKAYSDPEINGFISELNIQLDNNDLGKVFYRSLTGEFACKLIDFEDFDHNVFHVVTELTCKNGEEEFRPDITILIHGMPLAFIEVKKPNNRDGVLAERDRINKRFKNPKFKKFMNITQLLIFSNNQEYDEESITPILGAFYASPDPEQVKFNCFREEDAAIICNVPSEDEEIEKQILLDNNLVSILGTPEYETAKQFNSPTNRILTSLFSRNRLKTILKYGIAYVISLDKAGNRIEKHIMRYPQLFATLAIENKLKSGIKKETKSRRKNYYQKNTIRKSIHFNA